MCQKTAAGSVIVRYEATYFRVPQQDLVHVVRAKLRQSSIVPKDDDCDGRVCERSKLMSLFEKTSFSFEIGDLTISTFLDRLDLDLFPTHDGTALEKKGGLAQHGG